MLMATIMQSRASGYYRQVKLVAGGKLNTKKQFVVTTVCGYYRQVKLFFELKTIILQMRHYYTLMKIGGDDPRLFYCR